MFKSIFLNFSILLVIASCAMGQRTMYGPVEESQSGGYSDVLMEDGTIVSRFSANAFTQVDDAGMFARLRAVQYCRKNGFRVVNIFNFFDRTQSQTVTKSSNYNYQTPTQLNGVVNSNGNYSADGYGNLYSNSTSNFNGQITGGNSFGGSQTWNEIYNYPVFDVHYRCQNKVLFVGIKTEDLNSDQVHKFSKDFLGALNVIDVLATSPNVGILKVGDVILKLNSDRVQNFNDLVKHVQASTQEIPAVIIRGGKIMNLKLKTGDKTAELLLEDERILSWGCTVDEVKDLEVCGGAKSTN
jgi:hypothetical protein